jgi:1-acyl-sn-glycerol-3-phosphate acyltransferase
MPAWKLGLAKLIAAPGLFLLGPVRVFGRTNVPRSGGLLIFANHLSALDPILVQWACSRHVFFMAEEELFAMPLVKFVTSAWQAFPVKQDSPDRRALRRAIHLLQEGHVVCIFPEGGLSRTEELDDFKGGVSVIMNQWAGPAIGLRITGSRKALPYGSMRPRPALGWITLRWGNARTPPPGLSQGNGVDSRLAWLRTELDSLA